MLLFWLGAAYLTFENLAGRQSYYMGNYGAPDTQFIRLEKKFWKIEHASEVWVHGYILASRRSILTQFSTICSLVLFPSR